MAVVLTTARAPSRPVAVVKHHASDPDKGKRARECKSILLAYPEFLATLCVINAACDARAVALEGVDARQAARGAAARRSFQEGEQETWDGDAEERGIGEVAEDFVALFLLSYLGKG
ncbi:hypothetical protein VE02_06396, partial [Pseudogymnoascus sp. 03VT05]